MEIEKTQSDYYADSMLVVYNNGKEGYYMESHEIMNGKPQAGKPLSVEAVQKLREALINMSAESFTAFKGVVPLNLLYLDSDVTKPTIIWHTPEMERKLLFSKETGVKSGKAKIPPMIWRLKEDELTVLCYIGNLDMKSKLFYAPFPNVHEEADVCMGNVDISTQDGNLADTIKHVENGFFNSYFNAIHHPESCTVNIYDFWKWNMAANLVTYSYLVPHKKYKNLKQFIDDTED